MSHQNHKKISNADFQKLKTIVKNVESTNGAFDTSDINLYINISKNISTFDSREQSKSFLLFERLFTYTENVLKCLYNNKKHTQYSNNILNKLNELLRKLGGVYNYASLESEIKSYISNIQDIVIEADIELPHKCMQDEQYAYNIFQFTSSTSQKVFNFNAKSSFSKTCNYMKTKLYCALYSDRLILPFSLKVFLNTFDRLSSIVCFIDDNREFELIIRQVFKLFCDGADYGFILSLVKTLCALRSRNYKKVGVIGSLSFLKYLETHYQPQLNLLIQQFRNDIEDGKDESEIESEIESEKLIETSFDEFVKKNKYLQEYMSNYNKIILLDDRRRKLRDEIKDIVGVTISLRPSRDVVSKRNEIESISNALTTLIAKNRELMLMVDYDTLTYCEQVILMKEQILQVELDEQNYLSRPSQSIISFLKQHRLFSPNVLNRIENITPIQNIREEAPKALLVTGIALASMIRFRNIGTRLGALRKTVERVIFKKPQTGRPRTRELPEIVAYIDFKTSLIGLGLLSYFYSDVFYDSLTTLGGEDDDFNVLSPEEENMFS